MAGNNELIRVNEKKLKEYVNGIVDKRMQYYEGLFDSMRVLILEIRRDLDRIEEGQRIKMKNKGVWKL